MEERGQLLYKLRKGTPRLLFPVSLLDCVVLNKSWKCGQAPGLYHLLSCTTDVLWSSANVHVPWTKFNRNAKNLLNVKMLTVVWTDRGLLRITAQTYVLADIQTCLCEESNWRWLNPEPSLPRVCVQSVARQRKALAEGPCSVCALNCLLQESLPFHWPCWAFEYLQQVLWILQSAQPLRSGLEFCCDHFQQNFLCLVTCRLAHFLSAMIWNCQNSLLPMSPRLFMLHLWTEYFLKLSYTERACSLDKKDSLVPLSVYGKRTWSAEEEYG